MCSGPPAAREANHMAWKWYTQFGWLNEDPNQFHPDVRGEPVGEGDGLLAAQP